MSCPSCQSDDVYVLESRLRSDGVRRRRYKCLTCRERWTAFEEPSAPGFEIDSTLLPKQPSRRQLKINEVEEVLLSTESLAALARRFGVSSEAIRNIKANNSYQDVYKRLVLEGKLQAQTDVLLCVACAHWRSERGCDFGFPDAGDDFATDCYLFRRL